MLYVKGLLEPEIVMEAYFSVVRLIQWLLLLLDKLLSKLFGICHFLRACPFMDVHVSDVVIVSTAAKWLTTIVNCQ